MTKHLLLCLATMGFCSWSALGQEQSAPKLSAGVLGCQLDWTGINDRTYFILRSLDLEEWTYFTDIETGDGNLISYGFACSAPAFFLRLHWTDAPVNGTAGETDFDGDGLTTDEELNADPQTSPLIFDTNGNGISDTGLVDDDGDGIPSTWEVANGYDPLSPDAASVLQDYLNSVLTSSSSFDLYTPLRP